MAQRRAGFFVEGALARGGSQQGNMATTETRQNTDQVGGVVCLCVGLWAQGSGLAATAPLFFFILLLSGSLLHVNFSNFTNARTWLCLRSLWPAYPQVSLGVGCGGCGEGEHCFAVLRLVWPSAVRSDPPSGG